MVVSDRSFPRSGAILVVDDDPFVRQALQRSLKRLGYHRVIAAGNGEEGLALVESSSPEVAFADLRMPGMDGHAFMRALAAKQAPTAVVVISGHGTSEDVLEVFKNGGVDFLPKPWRADDLETALTRAFEVHAARARKLAVGARPSRPILFPSLAPLPPLAREADPPAPQRALDRLTAGEVAPPPVPEVVRACRAQAQDAEAIASALAADPELASRVLAVARSAAYAGPELRDLAEAAQVLGAAGLSEIVETVFLRDFGQDGEVKLLLIKQWRTGVARAMAMRALVEGLGERTALSPAVAFQVGLFAELGASFMVWGMEEQAGGALFDLVRKHHAGLGADLVTRWGFDPEVARAIRSHHDRSGVAPASPYALLLVVAGDVVRELCEGAEGTVPDSRERVLRCAAAANLGPDVLAPVAAQLRRDWVAVLRALG